MADVVKLPTNAEIDEMDPKTLIMTFNAFASTAGRNPVNKFATRAVGVKRLTELAAELRAKGAATPTPATKWPLVAAKPAAAPAAKPVTVKKAAPVAGKKPNLSARLREEINAGKSNDEVWAIIQPEFKLGNEKKGYVAGQRRAMAKATS